MDATLPGAGSASEWLRGREVYIKYLSGAAALGVVSAMDSIGVLLQGASVWQDPDADAEELENYQAAFIPWSNVESIVIPQEVAEGEVEAENAVDATAFEDGNDDGSVPASENSPLP